MPSFKFENWFLFLGLFIQSGLIFYSFDPAISPNGDNAKYFILGKSIAESFSYRSLYHPDEPVHKTYPPLFPGYLAILRMFSPSYLFAKISIAVLSVLLSFLCYRYFRAYSRFTGHAVLIFMTTSFAILQSSSAVLSEVPFLVVLMLAAFSADRMFYGQGTAGVFFRLTAVSALPLFVRPVGIAFNFALLLMFFTARKFRWGFLYLLLISMMVLGYRALNGGENAYTTSLFQINPYSPELGIVNLEGILTRYYLNFINYTTYIIGFSMMPFSWAGIAVKVLYTVISLIILLGWATLFRSGKYMPAFFLPAFFLILFLWPNQWSSFRFLISALPFIAATFFSGIERLVTFFKMTKLNTSVFLYAFVVLIMSANGYCLISKDENGMTGDDPQWKNFNSCNDWIRENTPDSSLILSRKPELTYLRTDRKSLIYNFSNDVGSNMRLIDEYNIDYVIMDGFSWTGTSLRYLAPLLLSYPDRFTQVYAVGDPPFYVFKKNAE